MSRRFENEGICELCGRFVERRTRHHLIPRTRHGNKRVKRLYDRETLNRTVPLCPACHRQIHRTFTEEELGRDFNTVEALLGHPEIARFVKWIEKKPHGVVDEEQRARRTG